MASVEVDRWCTETARILDLIMAAFGVALYALPSSAPAEVHLNRVGETFPGCVLKFQSKSDVDRLEREIADAFLLRLKGAFESQLKQLTLSPNWKTAEELIASLSRAAGRNLHLSEDDIGHLGQVCALRNAIAHCDGRVDEKAQGKGIRGPDVWLMREEWFLWLGLFQRIVRAIAAGEPAQTPG